MPRDEFRIEQRWFYVWLGLVLAMHGVVITGVLLIRPDVVRQHSPMSVVSVSLVSLPGLPASSAEPLPVDRQTLPAVPPAKREEPEPVIVKKIPESLPPKPRVRIPELSVAEQKIPEKEPVRPLVEPSLTKESSPLERNNLLTALEKLKKNIADRKPEAVATPTDLGTTLANLQKKVASQSTRPALSGSGAKAGAGHTGAGGGAFDRYKAEIAPLIQSNWSFSRELVRNASGMEVYVSIRIMPDGSVSQVRYDRKSPSEYLNKSVMVALEKSAPFPPLPKEAGTSSVWIGFYFTPEGVGP